MVELNLGEMEFYTRAEIINTLNEIQNAIEIGYNSGITCGGVCWYIDGKEEPEVEYLEETFG